MLRAECSQYYMNKSKDIYKLYTFLRFKIFKNSMTFALLLRKIEAYFAMLLHIEYAFILISKRKENYLSL